MKRKFFKVLFLSILVLTKVNAAPFRLTIPDFFAKPVISQQTETPRIYVDITDHWCNYAAQRLYDEDIFTGIKIGDKRYFMPEEYITRGEFLLYLEAVLNTPSQKTSVLPFTDAGSIPIWQLPTVCYMYENGYIKGNIEKNQLYFNHDEKISRLECAIILNNLLNINNTFDTTEFYDNYLIPAYAVTAVKNVSDYGLMKGYEDKSFRPYIKITRAMLADILCNVKDYADNKK